MKNRFMISESEKNRILGLHEQFAGSGDAPDPLSQTTKPTKPIVATTMNADIVKTLETMKTTTPEYTATINMVIKMLNSPTAPQISKTSTPDDILKLITPLFPNPKVLELVKTSITTAIPSMKFPPVVAEQPTQPAQPAQPIQLGVENPKIKEIQNLLNGPKYNAKLVPDGKWGPKTATALQKAIAAKKSAVVTPAAVGDVSGTVATQTNVS